MLVAYEGGSILRAFFLLISVPFLWIIGQHSDMILKIMTFISFCGLRTKDTDLIARAVLPRFYLKNLHLQAYEMLTDIQSKHVRRVVITSLPRVMVELFLKEYLSIGEFVAVELEVSKGGCFTGLSSFSSSHSAMKEKSVSKLFGDRADVALVSPSNPHDHILKVITVNKDEHGNASNKSSIMPRNKYPKPLIFHDGRLAFLPTPFEMLALFMWLPLGILLSIIRMILGHMPYKFSFIVGTFSGIRYRVNGLTSMNKNGYSGVLYVCNHRTLLDPIMLCSALQRPVPAVVYSLSKISEMISPINTVRLTRDRDSDSAIIRQLLSNGDLVVCPEGTTCREPYLLRFSPLFAELTDEIVPVAMAVNVKMFYGTTVSGHKWLDPVFFLMNPMPEYSIHILEKVPAEKNCRGGRSAAEVANWVQMQMGEALGFECTSLTRKDKYMMLVGNEGKVKN